MPLRVFQMLFHCVEDAELPGAKHLGLRCCNRGLSQSGSAVCSTLSACRLFQAQSVHPPWFVSSAGVGQLGQFLLHAVAAARYVRRSRC